MADRKELLDMLRQMYRIRFFEEYSKKLYKKNLLEGNFMGALHTYVGEEAIAVGICRWLNKEDYVFSTHRGHGHFLAKGGSMEELMAELKGRRTGCSGGMGGSMHLFDPKIGFMGGNGIVGGGIPLAVGAAYSSVYRGTSQVTVCFFGDGAASQGTFHESLNLASLWKLPVVFVCENNCYAVTTAVSRAISVTDVAIRAVGYAIPGKVVDGNDVLKVSEEARVFIEMARKGKGPSLLECKTYRRDPHCMVIPETRSKEELEKWKKKDPLLFFERYLEEKRIAGQKDFEKIRKEVTAEIEEAERSAEEKPLPDQEEFKKFVHNEI